MRTDTIDERLALFREMAEHAGVDLAALAAEHPQEVRAAAQRCLGCRDAPECRHWFETREEATPLPGFCRNADRFGEWAAEPSPAPRADDANLTP